MYVFLPFLIHRYCELAHGATCATHLTTQSCRDIAGFCAPDPTPITP